MIYVYIHISLYIYFCLTIFKFKISNFGQLVLFLNHCTLIYPYDLNHLRLNTRKITWKEFIFIFCDHGKISCVRRRYSTIK